MKIAVLSDTHGNYPLAITLLDRIKDPDFIIHLGDTVQDADLIECALDIPLVKLAGNCDHVSKVPRERFLNMGGIRLFLSHGDLFGVKNGIEKLFKTVSRENVGIVLYGHTHVPAIQKKEGILLINPGALKCATRQQSLAILGIKDGKISAEVITAAGERILYL